MITNKKPSGWESAFVKLFFLFLQYLALVTISYQYLCDFCRIDKNCFYSQYFVAIAQIKIHPKAGEHPGENKQHGICLSPGPNICFENFYHLNFI